MKVISVDFRMLVYPCETEYPPGTRQNIFGKLKFDMAGEWEVGVVIIKKETEGLFVCRAKYYGDQLAEHKSHQEKLQELNENLQSLLKIAELKQSG